MATFFLAMVLRPGVQHKAREEIDRVVGDGRLPSVKDRGNLPYIEAVLKEAFRWHPIAPMGLPHLVTEDDVYQGYLIPKGAIIIPNLWFVPTLVQLILYAPSPPNSHCSSLPSPDSPVALTNGGPGGSHMTHRYTRTQKSLTPRGSWDPIPHQTRTTTSSDSAGAPAPARCWRTHRCG